MKDKEVILKDLIIFEAMIIEETSDQMMHVIFRPAGEDTFNFEIRSRKRYPSGQSEWKAHFTGKISLVSRGPETYLEKSQSWLTYIRAAPEEDYAEAEFYKKLSARGIDLGPSFRPIKRFFRRGNKIAAFVELTVADSSKLMRLHPSVMDAGLQLIGNQGGASSPYIPFSIDTFRIRSAPAGAFWCEVELVDDLASQDLVVGSFRFVDESGRILCEGTNCREKFVPCWRGKHPGWRLPEH